MLGYRCTSDTLHPERILSPAPYAAASNNFRPPLLTLPASCLHDDRVIIHMITVHMIIERQHHHLLPYLLPLISRMYALAPILTALCLVEILSSHGTFLLAHSDRMRTLLCAVCAEPTTHPLHPHLSRCNPSPSTHNAQLIRIQTTAIPAQNL